MPGRSFEEAADLLGKQLFSNPLGTAARVSLQRHGEPVTEEKLRQGVDDLFKMRTGGLIL